MPGEKGKTYYLDWMDKFNELRRIPAHPSAQRPYTQDDYEFLDWLGKKLDVKQQPKRSSDATSCQICAVGKPTGRAIA